MRGEGEVPCLEPTVEQLSALFSELGLTRDLLPVAYADDGRRLGRGRLLWTLELIGHTRYSYLNGGIHAWREGGPAGLSKARPAGPLPASMRRRSFAPRCADRAQRTGRAPGREGLRGMGRLAPEEYRGEKGENKRLGHIPGAVNLEWTQAMDRERALRIRDYAELITELEALGLTPDMEVITHCQSHHRSGFTWLVGKALGFEKIRGYAGSWKEWGNRDDTPIE